MSWRRSWLQGCLTWLIIGAVTTSSSDDNELPNALHVMAGNVTVKEDITADPNGYVLFCPCMGRFGNQMSQYIGAIAFAKGLDRTLVLPPFVKYRPRTAGSCVLYNAGESAIY